jgi:asparagine N-glycosylation enzyme membrane subunit Stt3
VPFSLSQYLGRVRDLRLPKLTTSLALIGLTLLAFWIRIRNWPMVLTHDGVRFVGNDTLYHMRRVFQAVAGRLVIPDHDFYLNFPDGLHPNWPPLYDQFMAAIALLLGRGQPSSALVELVGALTPPVLGALTIPVLYHIARRLMSRPAALAAAAAGMLLPYGIQVAVLGRPDHHVAALLCSSLLLLSVMRALEARTLREAIRGGCLAGLFLLLCMGVWMGSLLLVFALGVTFVVALFIERGDDTRSLQVTAAGTALFGTAAVLFAPIGMTSYFAQAGLPVWDAPSPLHVFLLGAAALGLPAWRWWLRACRAEPIRQRARDLACGTLLMAVIAVGAWHFNLFALLSESREWILKKDPLLMRLVESQPLGWRSAAENFTRLAILMPLLLGWVVWEQVRRRRALSGLLLLVWATTLTAMALRQERFSDLLSIIAALLLGKALEGAVTLVQRLWRGTYRASRLPSHRVAAVAALLLGAGFIYAALPPARWIRTYWYSAPRLARDTTHHLCRWLREHTPDPGGYHDGTRPAYAVLASWPYGHAITYVAQRPNVANPYVGWKENHAANLMPYRFFVSADPAEGARLLTTYSVRYVVVTETLRSGHFADMLQALDLPHDTFFQTHQGPGGPIHRPRARLMQSLVHRLYLQDGAGMTGFRRVYSSPTQTTIGNQTIPLLKIFEFDGASGARGLPQSF